MQKNGTAYLANSSTLSVDRAESLSNQIEKTALVAVFFRPVFAQSNNRNSLITGYLRGCATLTCVYSRSLPQPVESLTYGDQTTREYQ